MALGFAQTRNLRPLPVAEVPELGRERFLTELAEGLRSGLRAVQLFANSEPQGAIFVWAVLADDARSSLFVARAEFSAKESYPSLTPEFPELHLFERELMEQSGIVPAGHPWLKPVRYGVAASAHENDSAKSGAPEYRYFRVDGDDVHEVAVGPIHAGIIEPGHFRFSCHGEEVLHLEIQLGFQHRGVEQLFIENRSRPGFLLRLAESIAGDTVIGHAGTYVRAVEALTATSVSRRAKNIRTVALELERIAVHLGDLSALANDVAYLTGSAVFGALRTLVINTTMAMCGSRFGRDLLAVGGVRNDVDATLRDRILATVAEVEERAERGATVMFGSPSVMVRFENTGILKGAVAREIGAVGLAARASGVPRDVRADHPYGGFALVPVHALTMKSGDVYSRAYLRYVEITQSARTIREHLAEPGGGALDSAQGPPAANSFVCSMGEGWRGEIVHSVITDSVGRIRRYKITDPSFHNWLGLALAVRGNGISEFPLCNKSFNLSYCGFDL